ncbi:hypothetical protein [Brucella inopinata]|uniref:hypothetical protein n=1 Tax=Brucella inopinata TaxID=1218315 RepID=UPI000870BDF3|nr:hypothetical protein [Brucella inopinata]SCD25096.1 hypothetical protein BR141012304_20628 [Brucella inopinata]
MFDNLNNLEASISAIRAFNHLITSAIEQGDDFSYVASGVNHLLSSQCEELERLHQQIRSDFSGLKQQADQLSTKLVLNRVETEMPAAATPVSAVPGTDYYHQNQLLIARLHSEGKSVDEIAALTALDRTRVRIFIETMPESVMSEVSSQTDDKASTERVANKLRGKKTNVAPDQGRAVNE